MGPLARDIGLHPECIVSPGGGDNMMGAIGTGNVTSGIVTVSLGGIYLVWLLAREARRR